MTLRPRSAATASGGRTSPARLTAGGAPCALLAERASTRPRPPRSCTSSCAVAAPSSRRKPAVEPSGSSSKGKVSLGAAVGAAGCRKGAALGAAGPGLDGEEQAALATITATAIAAVVITAARDRRRAIRPLS